MKENMLITAEELRELLEARGFTVEAHITYGDHRRGFARFTKDGLTMSIDYEYDTIAAIERRIDEVFPPEQAPGQP